MKKKINLSETWLFRMVYALETVFLKRLRKPKLETTIKRTIIYSDGTEKELSEDQFYKETGCRVTIKQIK